MPSRIVPFVNGEYYHIFNRGVAKIPIFNNAFDFKRFMKTTQYYQIEGPKPRFSLFNLQPRILDKDKKLVDIICLCLMPNHFHFLLQQRRENGITEFVSKLTNSYTKYYNTKYKRVGPLFQGEFKSVYIDINEQLIHVSRYIHLNPLVANLVEDLTTYKWSSYREYIGVDNSDIYTKDIILDQFKSQDAYKEFVNDQADYGLKLELIKHQLIDFED